MALSDAQKWANAFGANVNPQPSFTDRFAHDVSNTAKGFVPGILEIGKSLANDVASPITGNSLRSDDLGKSMFKGFMDQSFIPALAQGQFGEAWNRFSARPFSGLLDATMAAPAYRGGLGIAQRVGTTESRANALSLGGYSKLAPSSQMDVQGALTAFQSDPTSFGRMPATLGLADGTSTPARNYFGLGQNDVKMLGEDMWARPVHRTLKPIGANPELSALHTQQLDAPTTPDGTPQLLDDDLSQWNMSPRAETEIYAKAGDALAPLMQRAFPSMYSKRWGRRIAKNSVRSGNLASDNAHHDMGQAWAKLEDGLPPELRDQMDPDSLANAVGLAAFVDSHGMSPDEIGQVRDYYRADALEIPENITEYFDLPLYEFQRQTNTGFFPYKEIEEGKRTYDDPFLHEDRDLTVRELMDKYGDDLPNRFSYESVSPALRDSLDEYRARRQDLHTAVQSRLSRDAGNPIEDALASIEGVTNIRDLEAIDNPIVQSVLQDWRMHKAGTGMIAKGARPAAFVKRALTAIAEGREPGRRDLAGRSFRSLDENTRVNHEATFDSLGRGIKTRVDELSANELDELLIRHGDDLEGAVAEMRGMGLDDIDDVNTMVKQYKDAQYRARTLNERTSAPLGIRDLQQGQLTRLATINPGIVNVLDEIANADTPLGKQVRDIMATEGYQSFRQYKDDVTTRGAEIERERLDANLLPEDRVDFNNNRFLRWMGDNEREGSFFPMRYQRREIDDSVPTQADGSQLIKSVDDSEPGSPFEVYLSGHFDTEPSIHMRNFQRQSDMLTHDRLVDNVRNLALELDDNQMSEYKDKIGPESAVGQETRSRPYVLLENDGPVTQEIRRLQGDIQMLAQRAHNTQDAERFKSLMDIADHLDLSKEDAARNLVLPTEAYVALRKEIGTGIRAVSKFYEVYRTAGDYWKFSVLHARFPSWFRNNWVGAQLMLAMSGGMGDFGSAYAKTMKSMDPDNHEMLGDAFPEARSLGSSAIARGLSLGRMINDGGPLAASREKLLRALNWLSDVNAEYADSPARLARVSQIFDERVRQVQELGRKNGTEIEDTPELREKMLAHEPTRQGIADEMLRDMVDFGDLNRFEKEWIIAIAPFYSWMKGSAKATGRLAADHPDRLWMMEQISDVGERESIADAGQAAPDFARSWYNPFGETWMSTSGWNPYESTLDLFNMSLGAVPGGMSYRQFGTENVFGMVNPAISGTVAATMGKDPFFGTPIENDNPMDSFLKMQTNNPVLNQSHVLAQALGIAPLEQGPTSTTTKSVPGSLANLAGIPYIDPRWSAVWSRGRDEAQERYRNVGVIGSLNPSFAGIS